MRIVCLLLLAGAACAPSGAAGQAGKPTEPGMDYEEASTAMRSGLAALKRNNLPSAEHYYRRAVTLAPRVAATYAGLGSVLLQEGEYAGADRALRDAHRLDPKELEVAINLARASVGLRDYNEAAAIFREAITADPPAVLKDDEVLSFAIALSGTGDLAGAKTQLQQSLLRLPNSALLHDALGSLLAQTGALDEAVPQFERAVALDPSLGRAQIHLGALLIGQGRFAEAIPPLESAVAAEPNNFDANLQLGRALSATHRDVDALPVLHHAADLRQGATVGSLYDLAAALQASGDAEGALPLLAMVTSPQSGLPSKDLGPALIRLALARVQTGDAAAALPLYARALSLGPDTAMLRDGYGVAFLRRGDLEHAIAQFRAGLALDAVSAHLHYDLGLALRQKGDSEGAIAEFRRAAELEPKAPEPHRMLSEVLALQGRSAEAEVEQKRAAALAASPQEL